jgi:hypothetical protein
MTAEVTSREPETYKPFNPCTVVVKGDCSMHQLHEQLLPTKITYEEAQKYTKHELEQSIKNLSATYKAKYSFKQPPLCSNLPRVFNEEQLKTFFHCWPLAHEEARRRLLRAFFYGLRVGEIEKTTLQGDLVRVECNKKGKGFVYYLPFIKGTERLFPPYTSLKRYHPNYLAKAFTARCDALHFGERYSPSRDGRMLRRFTSHTLRRTAGNCLRRHTRDVYKAKVFLRHNMSSHFGCTARYLDYDFDEMRVDLDECFGFWVRFLL